MQLVVCRSWGLLVFKPIEGRGQTQDAHEGYGGLLIASGGPPLFLARPQAFDDIAVVVHPSWASDRRLVALGRNGGTGAEVPRFLAKGPGIAAAVGNDPARHIRQDLQQLRSERRRCLGAALRDRQAGKLRVAAGGSGRLGSVVCAVTVQRIEVIRGVGGRRSYSTAEKIRLVGRSPQRPGRRRRGGVPPRRVHQPDPPSARQFKSGELSAEAPACGKDPVSLSISHKLEGDRRTQGNVDQTGDPACSDDQPPDANRLKLPCAVATSRPFSFRTVPFAK